MTIHPGDVVSFYCIVYIPVLGILRNIALPRPWTSCPRYCCCWCRWCQDPARSCSPVIGLSMKRFQRVPRDTRVWVRKVVRIKYFNLLLINTAMNTRVPVSTYKHTYIFSGIQLEDFGFSRYNLERAPAGEISQYLYHGLTRTPR